jgi:thioredoxin 1
MIRTLLTALVLIAPRVYARNCGVDGEHSEINLKELQIAYSGVDIQSKLNVLARLGINAKTVQTATQETQQLNQYLQAIVAGYNNCAITRAQYAQATQNILPRLKQDSTSIDAALREIESGRRADEKRLGKLLQDCVKSLRQLAALSAISAKLEQMDRKLDDLLQRDREAFKAELMSSTPTLELMQAGFWAYRSFNLRTETGASFQIGDCPGRRCYKFVLKGISYADKGASHSTTVSDRKDGRCGSLSVSETPTPEMSNPVAEFCFSGPAMTTAESFGIALRAGNKIAIATPILDFNLIVESDKLSDIRLGLGIRDGSRRPDEGVSVGFGRLSNAPPSSPDSFYRSLGADPKSLPYRADADARTEIQQARLRAKQKNKILMIVFGGNWCPDCLVLDRNLKRADVRDYLENHVELVHVDVGYFESNLQLARDVGVNLGTGGVPAAAFFSANGEAIGNTNQGELESSRANNSDQVLAFLKRIVEERVISKP